MPALPSVLGVARRCLHCGGLYLRAGVHPRFTDVGEVSIAAGARNGHFAVSVTDTGPGSRVEFSINSTSRQLSYQGEGRHGPWTRHRQADRGDAWRPHLGRIDAWEGLDLPDGAPHARRTLEAHLMRAHVCVGSPRATTRTGAWSPACGNDRY